MFRFLASGSRKVLQNFELLSSTSHRLLTNNYNCFLAQNVVLCTTVSNKSTFAINSKNILSVLLWNQSPEQQIALMKKKSKIIVTSPAKRHSLWYLLKRYLQIFFHFSRLSLLFSPLFITAPLVIPFQNTLLGKCWWKYARFAVGLSSVTILKFLQWATTRRDIFPQVFCDNFKYLHYNSPSHPWETTVKTIESCIGENWREIVHIENEIPIGSGCVAQVYKGRMIGSGDIVAVKIIHPSVQLSIENDLDILRLCGKIFNLVPYFRWLSIPDSIEEFARVMESQTDLRREAQNLVRFRRNFNLKKPYLEFCSSNVLIESFEAGESVSRLIDYHCTNSNDHTLKSKISLERVAKAALESFLQMLFVHNFCHGDLHPGNFFYRKEIERPDEFSLVFLDVGIVTELESQDLDNFIDLFYTVAKGNGKKAGELLVSASEGSKCTDLPSFCNKMDVLVKTNLKDGLRLRNVDVAGLLNEVMSLCCEYHVKLKPQYASIIISIGVLEGLARTLDPHLNILKVALPIITQSKLDRIV